MIFGLLYLLGLGLICVLAASSGRSLHRPNGYSPRGGWSPRSIYVGNAKPPKHGSAHRIMTFQDLIDNKPGELMYYNAETDEFQNEKP